MRIEEVAHLCAAIIRDAPKTSEEFWPVWYLHPVDFAEARKDMLEMGSQPDNAFVIGKATFFPSDLCPRRMVVFRKAETNPLEEK